MRHPDLDGKCVRGSFTKIKGSQLVTIPARKSYVYICRHKCYNGVMGSSISVRELRNTVSEVLRRVESGERMTVTVDRRPVAELVPLRRRRKVPASEAVAIATRHASDPGLLNDVRGLLSDSTDDA
jgi:prevent-host-death family protein